MPKILLVDDSSTIRQELKNDLEEQQFYILEASDGEQGLALAMSEKIDLIITDLNMPNMDGITMCKHIRKHDIEVPIFMMTTQTDMDLKVEAKNYGVKAWIVKPYNKIGLISGIKNLLKTEA